MPTKDLYKTKERDNILNTVERILKLIKDKGITEKKFLTDLHFDKTALSQWKKGQNESYITHSYKIANYFKVNPDYLLCETDDPNPPNEKSVKSPNVVDISDLSEESKKDLHDYIKLLEMRDNAQKSNEESSEELKPKLT